MSVLNYSPRSGEIIGEDNKAYNELSAEGNIKIVTNWESAIESGIAFEMSAVADGSYALPAGHDMVLTAISPNTMNFSGFFINSNNNPIVVEFWENATVTGGNAGAVPSAINRNRKLSIVSQATISLNAYYTTPLTLSGGTLLTQMTMYSGTTAFDFANLNGTSEKWELKPNTKYSVHIKNNALTAASISARMLWFEE